MKHKKPLVPFSNKRKKIFRWLNSHNIKVKRWANFTK